MSIIPPPPLPEAKLQAARPSAAVLDFLNTRRSCPAPALGAPGPTDDGLMQLLRLAARVPDHRRLSPWRFLVFEGDARAEAGALFARRYQEVHHNASPQDTARERRRFCCAPVVVAVISSPDVNHKTPVWEQELSAGALCYNLLLAANAAGWAGSWLTGWMASDPQINAAFGLTQHERVAAFIHLGTARAPVNERPRPDVPTLVSHWRTEQAC